MNNLNVSLILSEIADLLKLNKSSRYKIRAYQKASNEISELEMDIKKLWEQGKLTTIDGIGAGIADKIEQILVTGSCDEYQELIEQYPASLTQLLQVKGVGPSKIDKFYTKLNVTNLKELKEEAENGVLTEISGIGAKTEEKILQSTKQLLSNQGSIDLGAANRLAEKLIDYLMNFKGVRQIEKVGALRRYEELVDSIPLLIETDNTNLINDDLKKLSIVSKIVESDSKELTISTKLGVVIKLYFATKDQFAKKLFWLTGSLDFNKGLEKFIPEDLAKIKTEDELFISSGLPYIIPELRDQTESLFVAERDKLPNSIKESDIKGDLHMHSNWSDGRLSIAEMAKACERRGYEYIAITDHTKSLKVANGLDYDRLKEQWAEIERVNQELEIEILKGAEVDILSDKLDYSNEILEELDIVIASIHSRFGDSQEQMMERIFIALENPEVNILGHPTGRLVVGRSSYNINFEKLVHKAIETNTILEINSAPKRLDLNAKQVKLAQDLGANFVVNTDAHKIKQLDNLEYGIAVARKGWLEKEDVINTLDLNQLKHLLKQ
ncbi:DNA polymerase/3'-5' exonuclease PolX [Halanaerocella petrolearia]